MLPAKLPRLHARYWASTRAECAPSMVVKDSVSIFMVPPFYATPKYAHRPEKYVRRTTDACRPFQGTSGRESLSLPGHVFVRSSATARHVLETFVNSVAARLRLVSGLREESP